MDAKQGPELCGCCEPPAPGTPLEVANRPGLSAISYRIGTFATFRSAMLLAIADQPELQELTTRQSDDAAITLLELWAAVGDVLTFYQERIANEALLRTALERDSVLRMVRLLDYHLRPGIAATTELAFTVEEGATVRIPERFPVMSVPGQDEQPQFFETVEAIRADARLNRIPILPEPIAINPFAQGRRVAFLTSNNDGWLAAQRLRPGEKVVLFNLLGGTVDIISDALASDRIATAAGSADASIASSALDVSTSADLSSATYADTIGWGAPFRVHAPEKPWVAGASFEESLAYWETGWEFEYSPPSSVTEAPEEKEIEAVTVERDRFLLSWNAPIVRADLTSYSQVRVFKRKMRVFGYDAPAVYATVVPDRDPTLTFPNQVKWESTSVENIPEGPDLRLDTTYKNLTVGEELLIYEAGGTPQVQVVTVTGLSVGEAILYNPAKPLPADSLADHRYRATVTTATVDPPVNITDRRQVTIYHLSGPSIPLWTGDFPSAISAGRLYIPATRLDPAGEVVEIGRTIVGQELKSGVAIRLDEIEKNRSVLLEDHSKQPILATIAVPPSLQTFEQQDFLILEVSAATPIQLETRTAVLLGNVAHATHGQTVRDEILGNGNAAIPFQKFTLRKSPLTYVPSSSSARGDSTLQILANRELWHEVDSLYNQPSTAPVYTVRQADDGTTTVQFGNGVTGARLPTGEGNLVATYRQGVGLAGRLKADQLSIPMERPLGLKAVTNPKATEGGADPETLDTARKLAPTTVKTFDRAVSLLDFECLVAASGEVAKAKATWVWRGLEKAVHLTVAGQEGLSFSPKTLERLHSGLDLQRDPNHTLLLSNLCRIPITLRATLQINERFLREDVTAAALQALLDYFDFEALEFSQPIHLSDIYRVLQDVAGVEYIDINTLHFKGYSTWTAAELASRGATAAALQLHLRLFAARPRPSGTVTVDPAIATCLGSPLPEVLPAEQAYIDIPAEDITLTPKGGLE